jgi:hypothetical protein
MTAKKPNLDETTIQIVKRMLSMPPKHHDEIKIGRKQKKWATKSRPAPFPPSGIALDELIAIPDFS